MHQADGSIRRVFRRDFDNAVVVVNATALALELAQELIGKGAADLIGRQTEGAE